MHEKFTQINSKYDIALNLFEEILVGLGIDDDKEPSSQQIQGIEQVIELFTNGESIQRAVEIIAEDELSRAHQNGQSSNSSTDKIGKKYAERTAELIKNDLLNCNQQVRQSAIHSYEQYLQAVLESEEFAEDLEAGLNGQNMGKSLSLNGERKITALPDSSSSST